MASLSIEQTQSSKGLKDESYQVQTQDFSDISDEKSTMADALDTDKNGWRYWLHRLNELLEIKQEGEASRGLVESFLYNKDLEPVDHARRTWTWKNYIFFWITGSFNVNTWEVSATGLQLGLSWWQTWICIWVGYSFVAVFLVLGSRIGNIYHLSFPISVRIPFGTYFSIWIVLNRLVMAVVWMSTLSWLGSECVQLMLMAIFGTDLDVRIKNTIHNPNLNNFQFMCYMLFWIIYLPFLWFPPHKLRYVFAVKSAITPFAAFGFLIWTLCKAHGHLSLGTLNTNSDGSAIVMSSSATAWAVIRSIMSAMNNFSTLILNAPDFSRFAKTPKSSFYSQLIALPICYGVISLVGILSASAAYSMYGVNYWNPLDILSKYLDHWNSGNRAGVFFISFAFAFDQLGANLSSNAIPAGTDMTALLPKYINIRRGAYICACLTLCICPWELMASSSKFTTALSAYAVFLSAIAGVVFADYFIVRKGYINLLHCYTNKPGSYYMYNKYGTNWRAVIAYIFGIVPNFTGFIGAVGPSVPVGAMKVYYLSYFIGYLISAITYLILVHFFPIDGVPDNAKLTDRVWCESWTEVEDFKAEREAFERYSGDEQSLSFTPKVA
ncbi:hypothetical protein KAFR_0B00640 [Kazachstania africana CBS 2517]|uniref:Allantoin permease n=1 Tax=Kazachstania africana (strain ATCC 22294 / BCRC 22015 / CBS 2517 / CECT 1963 / NBRC 1671 / NRRL Y-8276) TaxID=1071382 RepID=H2APR3_KAZAF|nr:hypothetical protein KAFR_0B00640 [Kazachstania africana CBS 2517]CCF56363.1 hypothetical protein KAFR_0B00640 [Kazachstania africana CBS 2517]